MSFEVRDPQEVLADRLVSLSAKRAEQQALVSNYREEMDRTRERLLRMIAEEEARIADLDEDIQAVSTALNRLKAVDLEETSRD